MRSALCVKIDHPQFEVEGEVEVKVVRSKRIKLVFNC
jgi:cytoskeletal protein CcmA (bactofilin family)